MTLLKQVKSKEIVVGRIGYGGDLLEELTKIAVARGIRLGRIEAIGAVQKARVGFYNQQSREYQYHSFSHPMEVAKLIGNISLKDGNSFVHAHITLADEQGKCYGGHLAPGTIVFACEFILEVFDGPAFNRCPDEETGLLLWSV